MTDWTCPDCGYSTDGADEIAEHDCESEAASAGEPFQARYGVRSALTSKRTTPRWAPNLSQDQAPKAMANSPDGLIVQRAGNNSPVRALAKSLATPHPR
jgi:hypothetical protein